MKQSTLKHLTLYLSFSDPLSPRQVVHLLVMMYRELPCWREETWR